MTYQVYHAYYIFSESKCGGILNATSGFIVPPDLDGDGIYDAHLRCSWVIEAQEDKMIEYQLLYLDIKESGRCADEELLVRDRSFVFLFPKLN